MKKHLHLESMGSTVTTFCNETNVTLYTSLSILITYYSTHNVQPGQCVSYNTGRVWFTASAELDRVVDAIFGNIFLPINSGTIGGTNQITKWLGGTPLPIVLHMPVGETAKVMSSPRDVIEQKRESIL